MRSKPIFLLKQLLIIIYLASEFGLFLRYSNANIVIVNVITKNINKKRIAIKKWTRCSPEKHSTVGKSSKYRAFDVELKHLSGRNKTDKIGIIIMGSNSVNIRNK